MVKQLVLGTSLMFLACVALAAPGDTIQAETKGVQQQTEAQPCRWWQFGHCSAVMVPGVPPEAPRTGTAITVDLSTNTLYLLQDGNVMASSPVATGTEKLLRKGSRVWAFHTPRGHLRVLGKIEDPIWHKPDWAFVEAGQRIPAANSPKRLVRNHLGKYALDLGDGILIHGTDEIQSIGQHASHGCVRVPRSMLTELWNTVPIGTDVYLFESVPRPMISSSRDGRPEHHSDLDPQ